MADTGWKSLQKFNRKHSGRSQVLLPPLPFSVVWEQIGDSSVHVSHADSFAASIALLLRPETVRTELIYNPSNTPVDWEEPDLDWAALSKSGTPGNPTIATPELGKRLWEATIDVATRIIQVAAKLES